MSYRISEFSFALCQMHGALLHVAFSVTLVISNEIIPRLFFMSTDSWPFIKPLFMDSVQ